MLRSLVGSEMCIRDSIFSWTGSALSTCYPQVILVTCLAIFAFFLTDPDFLDVEMDITLRGHTLSLFPVAFLLVFRNGISYNRFFEGRGHCGKFVHKSRTLSRLVSTHISAHGDTQAETKLGLFRQNVARYLRIHAIAQRHSVRCTEGDTVEECDSQGFLEGDEKEELLAAKKNLPLLVLTWLGLTISEHRHFVVYDRVFEEMDKCVDELMEAWMGMHKLATTPMPFPFLQMLLGLLYLWMLTVPFPLAISYGWAAPFISCLLGVALFGINAIGAELEDPMGDETNDLPLHVYEGAAAQAAAANSLGWPRKGTCLLYTSDAADEEDSVDLGGRRIIKKKKNRKNKIRERELGIKRVRTEVTIVMKKL
eukprot:TRINITY_DN13507_c0_g1_i3.p1 TRINITY_DN13507_c0_g1~~TRINITY_DN13507_c0_g1_i3.p1  ORF type:complete len:400 (+),score=111.98 TRINITY_DN13507_c0_g1_i3:101-1201(+)